MERYEPKKDIGLTKEQVAKRISEGLVNYDDQPKTKSIKQIIASNFFTYFNFLNIALGAAVLTAGILNNQLFEGLKNCLFMGVIIINSIISIIEEIISKKIIDRLSVISESKVTTIREGKKEELSLDELVLDDVTILTVGHQIVADSIILDGEVEVNESFLTGEPDAILKKKGDMLLSGSFIVSGSCTAKVEHVGQENYVATISKEAKYQKKANSVIMDSFEKLLKILSIFIIPIGIIMYFSQVNATDGNVPQAIFGTVASLIGMIPEGLVLLTSSVMAVSVIRLSKYKVLVQQLYCMETLARVDVICLDKTGTLTEGRMQVVDFTPVEKHTKEEMEEIINAFAENSLDTNATMIAIKEHFTKKSTWKKSKAIAFSSERKFSAISFKDKDAYYLGAPEVLLKEKSKIVKEIKKYQTDYRVLLLGSQKVLSDKPEKIEAIGIILIEDIVRKEAKATLDYFKKQGVMVKIISGDNVSTVLNIANKVGLKNVKGLDIVDLNKDELEKVVQKYDVFGRVTPKQKKWIIEILQESGRTVAMTGDGVNDVLALKKSDCAISIASGSDAARNVSQLVLLNDNFDALPEVVAEGRRTINNIERSSSLLLVKTIYTVLLILFSIIISSKYFFIPIQLTLITGFTIGIPSFILALEPNNDLVKGKFLLKIVSKSLPTALTVVFNIVLVTIFANVFHLDEGLETSLCVFLTAITGFIHLYKICKPFNVIRVSLLTLMILGFLYCAIFQNEFFSLSPMTATSCLIGFVLTIDSLYIFRRLNYFISKAFHKLDPTINIGAVE